MKAEINRDGLLILSPSTPTEEYAVRLFLETRGVSSFDGMPALPLDLIYVENCDD